MGGAAFGLSGFNDIESSPDGNWGVKMRRLILLSLLVSAPISAQDAPTQNGQSPEMLNFDLVNCSAVYLAVVAADYPSISNVKIDTSDMESKAERLLVAAVKLLPNAALDDTRQEIEEISESLNFGFGGDEELKLVQEKLARCDALDAKYGSVSTTDDN
jgi:hypothetical protein